MTYYDLFIILFMVIAFLAEAIQKKQLARFGKASAVCAVGALIGISLNLSEPLSYLAVSPGNHARERVNW